MAANVPGSTERAQQDLELLRFSKHPSMGRPNGGLLWVWFETPRTLSDDLAVVTRSFNGPGSENNTKRSNTFEGREHTASTRGHERRIFRGESEGDTGLARSCSTPELFPLSCGSLAHQLRPVCRRCAAEQSHRSGGAAGAEADRRGSAGTRAAVEHAEDQAGEAVPGRRFLGIPADSSEGASERVHHAEGAGALSAGSTA